VPKYVLLHADWPTTAPADTFGVHDTGFCDTTALSCGDEAAAGTAQASAAAASRIAGVR